MVRNKILYSVLGGAAALGLLAGGVAYAQTDTPTTAAPAGIALVHWGGPGGMADSGQALADALGIDLATLQTAQETARLAMIDQAVADGYLTAAPAEQLKLYSGGFGRGFAGLYDRDQYLADALGISVKELQAAELEAFRAELAAAVEAGTLTQDEADLMLARRVAQEYLDTDALSAQIQSAYEAALAAAVADGAITQAQADALLAQMESASGFGWRGFGGFGGPGGHRGPGGPGGFGFDLMPNLSPNTAPSATPDTTTDTSLDA